MEKPPFRDPRMVFVIWAGVWLVLLAVAVAGNVGLSRYVARMRAQDPQAYLREAERLMNANEFTGAFAQLDEAARRAPQSPEPYRLRGLCHLRLKHWGEAFDAFQAAIERGSQNEDMVLKALAALLQTGRFEDAVRFGEKRLAEGYRYKAFYLYLGDANRALGKDAESVRYYEQAVAAYGNDLFVMERLEQAYRKVGATDKADALRKRISEAQAELERAGQ